MKADYFFKLLHSRELLIVIDNYKIRKAIQKFGFINTAITSEFNFFNNSKPLLWLISDYKSQYKMASLWDETSSIIVQMTESKASGSADALLYSFEKLLNSDHKNLIFKREEAYKKLLTYSKIDIYTNNSIMRCSVAEEVEIANKEFELEPGYLYSLTEFFKASIINMDSPTSTFILEGKFAFEGFLHQANTHELKHEVLSVMQYFQDLFQLSNNYLYFEDNRITRLILGNTDVSGELLSLCKNKEWETNATEFSLAVCDFSANWSLNTLFHQVLTGVHVGMGKGEKIPFLDFSSTHAKLNF